MIVDILTKAVTTKMNEVQHPRIGDMNKVN